MKTNLDPSNGILTVTINGDLISTTAARLRADIHALCDTSTEKSAWQLFRLDLAGAKMVDSVGLNFIITILKAVQKKRGKDADRLCQPECPPHLPLHAARQTCGTGARRDCLTTDWMRTRLRRENSLKPTARACRWLFLHWPELVKSFWTNHPENAEKL